MLLNNPLFQILAAASLGLLLGGPLAMLIRRLPLVLEKAWEDESLQEPQTFRPSRIPYRGPLAAALSALLFGLCALRFGISPALPAALLFCWLLLAMSFIDWEHQLLPDVLSLGLLWAGLLLNTAEVFTPLAAALWGAAAGYLILWCSAHLFRFITGREGMGYGDCKLLAALGAWLGWQSLPALVLLASLSGVALGGAMILLGRRGRREPLPFGPHLALAGLLVLLWGQEIRALGAVFFG